MSVSSIPVLAKERSRKIRGPFRKNDLVCVQGTVAVLDDDI